MKRGFKKGCLEECNSGAQCYEMLTVMFTLSLLDFGKHPAGTYPALNGGKPATN